MKNIINRRYFMNEFYLIIRIAKKKPPFTKGGFF